MKSKLKYIIPFCLLLSVQPLLAQDATYTNSIGMEFILIKPGTMTVGKFDPVVNRPAAGGQGGGGQRGGQGANPGAAQTPAAGGAPAAPRPVRKPIPEAVYKRAEEMASKAGMPGFSVTIDKPYYIGKHEVTQEQWEKVMGTNPSVFKGATVTDDAKKHPVENILWKDAQAFVKKLNALDKEHVYRVPSEFEWEYAARAGAQDDIPWTDIRATAVLGGVTTTAVGTKKPNAWGIYDMLGNVWEWTQDGYNEKIFADPVPPKKAKEHVLKGASFTGDVKNATYMTHAGGPGNGFDNGLRIVMEVKK